MKLEKFVDKRESNRECELKEMHQREWERERVDTLETRSSPYVYFIIDNFLHDSRSSVIHLGHKFSNTSTRHESN